MEMLVRRFDLMTAGHEQRGQFSDELRHYDDKYKAVVNEDDLLAAFSVLREGVCRPDFPGQSSDQCYFAKDILTVLMEWSAKLKETGRISSLDRLHEFCLDFLHDLIKQGPGTGHIELWVKMFTCGDFVFKEYYFNLKGDKLKDHLRFLMREFRTQETGPDKDKFKTAIDKGMGYVMDGKSYSDDAFIEAHKEFVELYIYMELSFLTKPKQVQDIHHRIAMQIYQRYKRNVFKDIEDPNMFKHFLKYLEDVICHTNLTTAESDNVLKKIEAVVKMLLSAIDITHTFHKVHGEILDLVCNICEKKAGSPLHTIVEAVGYFYYRVKEKDDDPIIKGNSELFSVMTRKLTEFLTNVEDHTLLRVKFADAAVHDILAKAMSKTPEHQRLMLDLIKACLRIRQPNTAKAAYNGIRECENMLTWKEHLDDAREIMDLVTGAQIYGSDRRAKEAYAECYNKLCDYLARELKRDRVIPQLADKIVEFSLKMLDKRDRMLFQAGSELTDEIELSGKKNKDLIMSIFKDLLPYLKDETFPWTGVGFDYGPRIATKLARTAIEAVDSRLLKPEDYDVICHFVLTAMRGNFIDQKSNRPLTVYYQLYCSVGTKFLSLLDDQEKIERCSLLIKEIVNFMTHEYDDVAKMACNQIHVQATAVHGAKTLAQYLDKILDVFIDSEHMILLHTVTQIYPHNPKPLEPHFQTIFELINSKHRPTVLGFLVEVAKKQPQLFTDENISSLVEEMFQGDDRMQNLYLIVLDTLSRKMPEKFIPHMKTLMEGPISIQYCGMYYICQILKNVVVRTKNEALAEEVMVFLEKHLRGPEDQMVTIYCLNEIRGIGGVYRHLLEKRKDAIEDLRNRSTVQTTKDQCTFILDVLEGRSLESLAEDIKDVKEDVEELDTRVTQTEVGLAVVSHDVGKQKEELKIVKTDVKEQGEKLGHLEESVDETKAKVEELDTKTLNHAPFWSRDVAKLMNPEDILDWRLLSSRLGYSNDDIRGWAQMHDPCMAMLNEWYATRKTSEATFAVFTALQEMDRLDAAVIVENAMKMSETAVEDEEFDYPEPPEVFISYQWGIQNEVKLLKQHLEKAGFTCWMDIGQMGGGDKLFEKIDKGIRGAKLIISCVTEKYAKSPNCNREVNLSVSLGKPIIPLLMEKLNWPPPGSMGPIFSEYLFIRFYTRPGEEIGDQRYWSGPKFQELLMQLSYNNVQPDEQNIEAEYKNWWCHVVEEIKIEKKDVKAMTSASQQKQEEVESGVTSPDVFISYQWGKQKQIQILYKRLTELGFTCWMDIHQMGGGDSLYDKIDKGVRGSRIVLSCVTNKYSFSANCRREVSLADSLKKPIVPLLLEKMTWPPSGPMSMVFTQLLYINFAKDELVQERWDGEKFKELLAKIDQYVPNIIVLSDEKDVPATAAGSASLGMQKYEANQERKADILPPTPPVKEEQQIKLPSPKPETSPPVPHQQHTERQLLSSQQHQCVEQKQHQLQPSEQHQKSPQVKDEQQTRIPSSTTEITQPHLQHGERQPSKQITECQLPEDQLLVKHEPPTPRIKKSKSCILL